MVIHFSEKKKAFILRFKNKNSKGSLKVNGMTKFYEPKDLIKFHKGRIKIELDMENKTFKTIREDKEYICHFGDDPYLSSINSLSPFVYFRKSKEMVVIIN